MQGNVRLRVGCVVMAAGNAARFGENKLLSDVGGRPLLRAALEAVPAEELCVVAVVTQYDAAAALAEAFGFRVIRNDRPDRGVSHTVRLGTDYLAPRCDAILYMVADQPLLRRQTVAAMVEAWRAQPERIMALGSGGVRGNPCLFPAPYFPELRALTGDTGGSAVIRRHPEALRLWEADARELLDVDTPQMLEKLNER